MNDWLLAILPEDLSEILSTHIICLTTPMSSDTFFWPLWAPIHVQHTQEDAHRDK